ncbi:MAG: hypothetical protein HYZ88_03245 [Candidatus Omnitrophica bacterium]|nr:hypothetical protein [Candidatus Omnitrophota bacterium]
MRWIGNIQHNYGWRGKVAQVGATGIALLIFWNARQPATQLAKIVSGWSQEVDLQSKSMEWAAQAPDFKKSSTRRILTSKEKAQMKLIATLGNSWLMGTMTAVLAGMILVGSGLLLAQNWARITVIAVYALWLLVTPWLTILGITFSSEGGLAGMLGRLQNLILGNWRPVAVILFLLWRPTRALFR